jgi:acetyl esterase
MTLDPQAQERLAQDAAAGAPPVWELPLATARANMENRPKLPGPEVASAVDMPVPAPDGDVSVRVYTPEGAGPFPVMVWMHGGGWVLGSVNTTDATCRAMANDTPCVVVSVEYRLAPETKFPGPAEDCYAVAQWVAANGTRLNVDASRMAIAGASAGGNLAAAVALMARDRGGPALVHQTLVYPVTDGKMATASYQRCASGYGLSQDTMTWYWKQYLASEADRENPYAAPARASDLSGLPPALVITGGYDVLADEGEAYANAMSAAGVPTTHSRYDGMIHGFFNLSAPFGTSFTAVAEVCAALRSVFAV